MPLELEEAWFAVHDALPPCWRVGAVHWDPIRHGWTIAAFANVHRHGEIPEAVEGFGADELAALWGLRRALEAHAQDPAVAPA